MQVNISVRLLAGRYHGAEWPPAPARLFQALICAGRTGRNRLDWTPAEEEALKWLERMAPPAIRSGHVNNTVSYTLFVPDNESDRAAEAAIEGGRFDMSKFRTPKHVSPRVMARSTSAPDVLYTWAVEGGSGEVERHIPALRRLAQKLFALGWGIDMACADASVSAGAPPDIGETFAATEDRSGTPLRVPVRGFAEDVLQSWDRFRGRITAHGVNPYTKATTYGMQHYRRETDLPQRGFASFLLQTIEGDGFSWPWADAPVVAAWLRHAAAAGLREETFSEERIAAEVLGHADSGNGGTRISYVPVPTVGHQYSDGAIRRVMLVESFGMDGEITELLNLKLASRALTEAGTGRVRARLVPISNSDRVLSFYVRESETWSTVTPMVLHGYNTAHGKLSQSKTERLLLQAFVNSGYPESLIREIAFRPACSWMGPGSAMSIRVPQHLAKWPRYHVWVRFGNAVRGPVLAGIGRHYGVGLFAARSG
jgi:CRISPR-associated protein Csb2